LQAARLSKQQSRAYQPRYRKSLADTLHDTTPECSSARNNAHRVEFMAAASFKGFLAWDNIFFKTSGFLASDHILTSTLKPC
jgi:hypothetical protein